jgi:hypothetical protein
VNGYVSGSDSLIIPAQELEGKTVQGVLHITGSDPRAADYMTLHYSVTDSLSGTVTTVDATF